MEKSTTGAEGVKDPITTKKKDESPAPITPTIPLDVYCSGLNQTGIDKFAKTIISNAINSLAITNEDKTREEWEAIYLKLKNT